jgi:hypothetical protein
MQKYAEKCRNMRSNQEADIQCGDHTDMSPCLFPADRLPVFV